MTTDRILKYLIADVSRADSAHDLQVSVSVEDLRYALGLAVSNVRREENKKATSHAGWVDPARLADLRSGKVNGVVMLAKKGPRMNTEVFFADVLADKKIEAELAEGLTA